MVPQSGRPRNRPVEIRTRLTAVENETPMISRSPATLINLIEVGVTPTIGGPVSR
jgi:hypothetical protein